MGSECQGKQVRDFMMEQPEVVEFEEDQQKFRPEEYRKSEL